MSVTLPVERHTDVAVVAAHTRRTALAAGFSSARAGEAAIVASELASNALVHGGGGTVRVDVTDDANLSVIIEAVDHGIVDVDIDALMRGDLAHDHIDARGRLNRGLGQGINAVKRLSDRLTATTARSGRGISVVATCRNR